MDDLRNIPVSLLVESTLPLRPIRYNSVEYRELVASVRELGVLQPLLVRPRGEKFEVVEGGHRWASAKECRRETVPCIVRELSDDEVLTIQVQANAIRPHTERAEFAERLYELATERKLTMPQLAALVHKSPGWIRDTLSLRNLNERARKMLSRGELTIRSATAISKLPKGMQESLLDEATTMSADDFAERCREVQKHFRECVREGRTDLEIMRRTEPYPWYRPLQEIRLEALNNTACAEILKLMGAESAIDGWRACLAWMLHLDPISIRNLTDKQEMYRHARLTEQHNRKTNRDIANSLMKIKDFNNEQ